MELVELVVKLGDHLLDVGTFLVYVHLCVDCFLDLPLVKQPLGDLGRKRLLI